MTKLSRIIAHRGAGHGEQALGENTMEAFRAAVDAGVAWLETDLRLLADGALVLFHDDTLKRICGTDERISELHAPSARAHGIAFLDEVLELDIGINLELKLDRGADDKTAAALGLATARALAQTPAQVFVSSFSAVALNKFKQVNGEIECGLACYAVDDQVFTRARELEAASIHSAVDFTTPTDVERVRRKGFESYVYAVDDPARVKPLWPAGLNGFFTQCLEKFKDELWV